MDMENLFNATDFTTVTSELEPFCTCGYYINQSNSSSSSLTDVVII